MHGDVYGVYDIQGVCDTDMCESGDGYGRMFIVCGNENVHVELPVNGDVDGVCVCVSVCVCVTMTYIHNGVYMVCDSWKFMVCVSIQWCRWSWGCTWCAYMTYVTV